MEDTKNELDRVVRKHKRSEDVKECVGKMATMFKEMKDTQEKHFDGKLRDGSRQLKMIIQKLKQNMEKMENAKRGKH